MLFIVLSVICVMQIMLDILYRAIPAPAYLGTQTERIGYWQLPKAFPIKCFVSHRPISCDGGSVGQAKKKKKE